MARTLATFYAFGGVAGLFITAGAGPGSHRPVMGGLSLLALASAAVATRWGGRWPRKAFHAAVGVATVILVTGVLASPDPVTALAAASLVAFVVVDAHLFFSGRQALAHLVVAGTGITAALLSQGVALGTALALNVMLIGFGIVLRQLVVRASDASRDPLTGLRNRRGFDDALPELMSEVRRTDEPLSAALIDVDHFKSVNDTYGHEAGDRLLCRIADVWRRELPVGAVLARHGGDEFSVLLPGMAGDQALDLVQRVCAVDPDASLSCGIAQYRRGDSASQLMRSADRALYDAKILGRGRAVLFDGGAASARPDGAAV